MCGEFPSRLVQHGAVLDTGWAGPLATQAEQAVVEVSDQPGVRLEQPAGNGLHERDPAAWRLRLVAVEPVSRTMRQAESAFHTLIRLLLYRLAVHLWCNL